MVRSWGGLLKIGLHKLLSERKIIKRLFHEYCYKRIVLLLDYYSTYVEVLQYIT